MKESPLVSVVIVTYNSAATIIETLDSVKAQTYTNIELIISDDCSSDQTISLCEEWIKNNGIYFSKVQLLRVDKNTGISANLNRAIHKACGIWIKSLAGDDLLAPSCIDECVKFVLVEKCQICMVKLALLGGNIYENRRTEYALERMYDCLKLKSREEQYEKVLFQHILPGPGIFYSKRLWEIIGGFDERFRDFEEYSFELAVLEKERIYFLDKPLVKWRQRDGSLTHSSKSPALYNDIQFYYQVRRPLLIAHKQYFRIWHSDIAYYVEQKVEFEEKSILYKSLLLLSPLFYVTKMKEVYNKLVL